jgi:hypothetical protein
MFEISHESFPNQPEPESVLWRYMDLARFLSLLEDQALHFARADQMSDKWEGAYGQRNLELRPKIYGEHYEMMKESFAQMRGFMTQHFHMSCWHEAPEESAAMWDIYQREGRGVAVKTTWAALTASVETERLVYGGRVNYVDYQTSFIPESNGFTAFMYKRRSFAHEREVRLLTMTGEKPDPALQEQKFEPEPPVVAVPVNLTRLIDAVYVFPNAPTWIGNLVTKVIERYGYNFPVHQSDLDSDPID